MQHLTRCGRDKTSVILQTFRWMRLFEFLNEWWLVYWRKYASLGLKELKPRYFMASSNSISLSTARWVESISPSRPPRDYNLLPPINHWNSGPISLPIITQCPLQWRHNEPDGVSNHQPHDCLLNRLFRRRSKKTLKLRVTGLCEGNSPVTGEFPAQRASNTENFSCNRIFSLLSSSVW